jgi:alpha-1,3-rhamnosyltransferase
MVAKVVSESDLVTVVIPSFNHRPYVETAVRSVLAQTYPHVQLIVIDDGSSDGSREVLQELAAREGFSFISQENKGVCRALNRAIRDCARGSFISLLGSDDCWVPDKIELQLGRLRQDPDSEFCFAQARTFHDQPADASGPPFPRRPREGDVSRHVLLRQHVPAGTMLFTRRLYDRLDGFDESLKEEDWDFVIRAAASTRFVAVHRPLLLYRAHPQNMMRTRARSAIFHQKALVFAKNFPLAPPGIWMISLLMHFVHDVVMGGIVQSFQRYRVRRANR